MSQLARHNDPHASHVAAATVEPRLNTLQNEVLDAFIEQGSFTDKELNEYFVAKGRVFAESTMRKRRSELTAMGKIKNTGVREGRHAVWELA